MKQRLKDGLLYAAMGLILLLGFWLMQGGGTNPGPGVVLP